MATLNLYTSFDMPTLQVFYGEVTSHDAKHITISDGYNRGTYFGSFTYSAYGLSGGTVTGYDSYQGNSLEAKYYDGNFNALTVNNHLQNSNANGLLSYVLSGNDTINGSLYNDRLNAYAGDDKLYGNTGDDRLNGDAGNDTLDGGAGNDELLDDEGHNTFNGGDGDDTLTGGTGNDIINGNNGNDTAYYSNATATTLNLYNTSPQNTISSGFDTLSNIENLISGNYNDTLSGNALANNFDAGRGDDKLNGGAGNDTLTGGDGNDGLNGGEGNDSINGGAGIDFAHYWNAIARVAINLNLTGPQNTLGAGIDTLIGIENLNGSNFNDLLTGNVLNNTLFGNDGNDILAGGAGNDILNGGAGNDTFVFDTAMINNIDNINGFVAADDTIQLENAIYTKLTQPGVINNDYFKASIYPTDNNDHLLYSRATGTLFYDADGNGAGIAVKIALLATHPTLTAADFIVS